MLENMSKLAYLSTIINILILPCFMIFISHSLSLETNNTTDYAALMAFKSHLILPPHNVLSTNWTPTTHFCNWYGVSCLNQSITNLHLPGLGIQGEISPHIANMTRLVEIDLSRNNLTGFLPSELGFLKKLRILNLTMNSLQGTIPSNLSHCHKLQQLDLSYNFLSGSIPEHLGILSNLRFLVVDHNNLTGKISASLGNLSRLEYFYLHENDLTAEIPQALGKLTRLTAIGLRGNSLTGSIPPSIFNISSLQIVDLSINGLSGRLPENLGNQLPNLEMLFFDSNRITGKIPVFLSNASRLNYLFLTENDMNGDIPKGFGGLLNLAWFEFEYNQISGGIPYELFNITSLTVLKTRHNYLNGELPHDLGNWVPNLEEIFLSHNRFSGHIPSSICNATKLTHLEVANNSFTGPVPMMLGKLVDLEHLNLQYNLLVNNPLSNRLDFVDSLVNSRNLQFLVLDSNPLNGVLPESVGNLSSNLRVFTTISCGLKGGIPSGFGNFSRLYFLGLSGNDLHGGVPESFRRLQNLERIYLTGNRLQGSISDNLCGIKSLGILHLGENSFSGSIPTCIQNLTELREVSFAANNLNSIVPLSFWNLVKLERLNLSMNLFHGSVPMDVGNLKAASILDFSSNNFSGEIPHSIGYLQYLLALDMSLNKFQGPIPNTLSSLLVIDSLDMSSNSLSGNIPASLGSLRDLKYLNLSYNMLQGEIPHEGIFTNITSQCLMGNPKLCGGAPRLNFPMCSSQTSGKTKTRLARVLKITLPIASTLLVIVACFLAWIGLSRKKHVKNATIPEFSHTGYQIITYYELVQATENFNVSKIIGKGSSATVYRGELLDGTFAAIKVFNMQCVGALKSFDAECRVLSNVRHRNLVKVISTCSNMEFKAMVLELMPNGSLDKWLYSETNFLTLDERMDIVIDVAMAMEYLHHEYTVPIVHCDLKPSNVLLDEDMTARVGDFGIAKFLAQDQETMLTKTLGTIGYIAPEYGLNGHVSTRGDVYSFGILLLEMFTGKRPTDDMFSEDLSLVQWVNRSLPDALVEVLDSNLFNHTNQEELVPIIRVAFLCLKELPNERIDMRGIVVLLKKVSDELRKSCGK